MNRYVLTDVARRQVGEIDEWWRTHRDRGDLFLDELDAALEQLLLAPESGLLDEHCAVTGTRTIILPKTRYRVFYRLTGDEIRVTAVWHSRRGKAPDDTDLARERAVTYWRAAPPVRASRRLAC